MAKRWKIASFWAQKLLKMTFNIELGSCNTPSSWKSTKTNLGSPTNPNAHFSLPVYPVLKDQSHENF